MVVSVIMSAPAFYVTVSLSHFVVQLKILYLQPHHVRSFVRPLQADDDRDHKNGLVSVEMGSGVANEANPGPEESLTCGTYVRRWDVGRR